MQIFYLCELKVYDQRIKNVYTIKIRLWNWSAGKLKYVWWTSLDVNSTKNGEGLSDR